jgi:Protein of unknown function (DUF3592)
MYSESLKRTPLKSALDARPSLWMTIVVYVTLALCFVAGVYLLYLGSRNVWRGVASASWPTVDGTIVSSEREVSRSTDWTFDDRGQDSREVPG